MPEHVYAETFDEYLRRSYRTGTLVNTVFEERVYHLVGVLSRIVDALSSAGISYQLIGGLAVFAHVHDVAPDEERTTKDVDLMVNRADLDDIVEAAATYGFRYRHTPGVDMLVSGEDDDARDAVHLVYAGEMTSKAQSLPNPELNPIAKQIRGKEVMVVPVTDLVRMKLATFRLKDQVHVQALDRAGLINPDVGRALPAMLAERLAVVRSAE